MTASERDLRIAYGAGESAARIKTKTIEDCPRYDRTLRGCAMVEEWERGFTEERARLAALEPA